MKIRNGFVSNSSSSSFIIAWKNELSEENILKALKVDEASPLYSFAKDLAKFIIDEDKETYNDWQHYKDEHWIDDEEESEISAKKLFDKGFNVGEFNASYNEYYNPIEGYLGNSEDFKIISDDLIILGEYTNF